MIKIIQGLAAVSTMALGVAGIFYQQDRAHEAELQQLQFECDTALEHAAGAESAREGYIAQLETDAQALLRAHTEFIEREEHLQESRVDLDLDLRDSREVIARIEAHYKQALQVAHSEVDSVGDLLALRTSENEHLEHFRGELLEAYGDQILSNETYRRATRREVSELSRTLAYEQWQKTVRIAVEGECRSTWGARKFERCALRVEGALRPHESGALECIMGGYGLPFYTEDQKVAVFPENSAVLKRGVVVPCDRSLHDRADFEL